MAAPVKHTCPDIDRLKKGLEEAYKELQYTIKMCNDLETDLSQEGISLEEVLDTVTDIRYNLDVMDSCLYSAADELEDLRSSNSSLREWGESLESEVDELEDLRSSNSSLREWGESLESEVDELNRQLSQYE